MFAELLFMVKMLNKYTLREKCRASEILMRVEHIGNTLPENCSSLFAQSDNAIN